MKPEALEVHPTSPHPDAASNFRNTPQWEAWLAGARWMAELANDLEGPSAYCIGDRALFKMNLIKKDEVRERDAHVMEQQKEYMKKQIEAEEGKWIVISPYRADSRTATHIYRRGADFEVSQQPHLSSERRGSVTSKELLYPGYSYYYIHVSWYPTLYGGSMSEPQWIHIHQEDAAELREKYGFTIKDDATQGTE